MKRQKIIIAVGAAMSETLFGSTERDDAIDRIEDKFALSSSQLRAVCVNAPRADYWNR